MDTIRVLVFPCGSEIGLEYHRALKDVRYIELYGASSVSDHGEFAYRNYIPGAPYVTDPAFAGWLAETVSRLGIDVVCPAMDSAIPVLARLAPTLSCKVLAPSVEAADVCRDKSKTYEALSGEWYVPVYYADPAGVRSFPVAMKPAVGQGSQGFKVIRGLDELKFELSDRTDPQVVCEYLPGPEYTVDCLTDRHGELRFAQPRVRSRTKAGISVRSSTVPLDEDLRKMAESISDRLGMHGVWFFQVKRNAGGEYRLLEVAPRVAGTMCLERALGVNLPALAILDALDHDVSVPVVTHGASVDRAFANSFDIGIGYGCLYIDYDDTLVCGGRVNLDAVRLVYQCANDRVPVVLLTRHDGDIYADLAHACLAERLFEEVVCLRPEEPKSAYIDVSRRPLFIDDSFSEREEVTRTLGVPTYGPESIEALLNGKA